MITVSQKIDQLRQLLKREVPLNIPEILAEAMENPFNVNEAYFLLQTVAEIIQQEDDEQDERDIKAVEGDSTH